MTHDQDCPSSYPCCPFDEDRDCPLHDNPCNCDTAEVVVTLSICLCCPDGIHAAREDALS